MGKVDRDQLDLGLAPRINVRRNRRVSPEMKRRRDNLISQMREVQYFAGTMSARREKIVCKRLALPVTGSPHVQGRSSSQPESRFTTKIWTRNSYVG